MLKNINVRHLLARPEVFGTVERVQVQMIFDRVYRSLGYRNPNVLCFDSPFQLQLAIRRIFQQPIPVLPSSTSFKLLDDMLRQGLSAKPINKKMWNLFSSKVASDLFSKYGEVNKVAQRINQEKEVYQAVESAVSYENLQTLGPNGIKLVPVAKHPNWKDQKWLELYADQIQENPLGLALKRMLDLGLMESYCFDKLVLWCPKPSEVHIKGGKLHHEKGPALAWGDQYKMFYWKGNIVPQKLIEAPELITKDEVQNEIRSNIRKSYFEKLGLDNFTRLFDLQIFDKDLDIEGREQILYRSREKDSKTGNFLQFAKVNCPNSGEEHLVSVPLYIKNIWEAFAYSLEHKPQEFCEAVN